MDDHLIYHKQRIMGTFLYMNMQDLPQESPRYMQNQGVL